MKQQATFSVDDTVFVHANVNADGFFVESSPRPYRVQWSDEHNPAAKINDLLAQNKNNVLFIDKAVYALYKNEFSVSEDQVFLAEATESFKTMDGVTQLLDFLYRKQFTKSNMLIVVGGGIIQDIGGFAAAIYKRGIKWCFFPTTLLAMCDSCIGAKTGVNYQKAKNQIGLFSAPHEVVINSNFLKTLPHNDILSGLGEVLKLCITGGENLLAMYSENVANGQVINHAAYKQLIISALSVKKAIIEKDEFEADLRKGLNYGHTLGHVIEALSDYQISHGTAVVIGMMLVNHLSYQRSYLNLEDKKRLDQLCRQLLTDDVLAIMQQISVEDLMYLLNNDKKVDGAAIKFVLLKRIGMLNFVTLQLDHALSSEISALLVSFRKMEAA